jgi:sulfide:quinone oxidoreductase
VAGSSDTGRQAAPTSSAGINIKAVMRKKGVCYLQQGARRVHPQESRVELEDGESVAYDYLVVTTGPDLAFEEIPGLGPNGHTQSICHMEHAVKAREAFERFCEASGPIVVGAVHGASCFGPAYEFAFILGPELRRRSLRDRVPMTFVTFEPYIGHLGLDGVGDTEGLLGSEMRDRHIKWIVNARVKAVEAGGMQPRRSAPNGSVLKSHELPFAYAMMLPAFRGVAAVRGLEGLINPRGFILVDKTQRNAAFPNIFGVGVGIAIPPVAPTPVPTGVPKTGFMLESMVTAQPETSARCCAASPPPRRPRGTRCA